MAEIVVETDELDHSWCHTVGYISPMVAAAAVGGHVCSRPIATDDASRLMAAGAR